MNEKQPTVPPYVVHKEATFEYRQDGKTWRLPHIVTFQDITGFWAYRVVGFRRPRAGEWFLSGAQPEAYRASHDMTATPDFLIVVPVQRFRLEAHFVPEERPFIEPAEKRP